MLQKFILAAVALLLVSNLSAAVRTYEDLPESKCKTAEVDTTHFPDNRDQNALGWCHAYALADLMSFYAKRKISSYSIAATMYLARIEITKVAESFYNSGGDPISDFYDIANRSNNKLCLESNFTPTGSDWGELSRSLAKVEVKYSGYEERVCSASYHRIVPGVDEQTLKAINKLSGSKFVAAVIEMKCSESISVPPGRMIRSSIIRSKDSEYSEDICDSSGRCRSGEVTSPDLPAETMDQFLDRNEPVLLSYDTGLLRDKGGKINKNYNHVSTIIGRKFNPETKQCEYLLRNSWGTLCEGYPPKYKCRDGNVWIPRLDLLKSAGAISIFEKNKMFNER